MDENSKINLTIENYTGEKPIVIVYREGVAGKVLDEKAPVSTDVAGVLSTPQDWLEKRVATIDQKKAKILVEREKYTITLIVNESDPYNKATISGTAELSEVFKKFGINDPNAGWVPAKLGQFIRLNRAAFEDKEQCMKLVSQLKNFTAKAKAEIQKQRDPSGSTADVYRQEVESNLPKSFTVNLAIFKGTAKQSIEVEFDHYLKDGEVFLQLVSPGANELTETYRDQCIDDVLDKIREVAPDIAILEV